jgi:hypothetical protein
VLSVRRVIRRVPDFQMLLCAHGMSPRRQWAAGAGDPPPAW